MSNMIRKSTYAEILNHWVLAASFFVLAISGFAFLFHLEGVGSVFGGFNNMRVIHNWGGVVFVASLFFTLFNYLGEALSFSSDDVQWVLKAGGYLSKTGKVPPAGKLNAGQKLFYLFLVLAGAAIAASGLVIWLTPGVKKWILISHLVHNVSFDLLVMAIPAHIYLGTLANPGTLRIMLSGEVPVEWARKKYPKWVKEMGL